MHFSKNIQFYGVLTILYLLLFVVMGRGLQLIKNSYILYPVMYLCCINILYMEKAFIKRCKSSFGVQHDDPSLFKMDKKNREIAIERTSAGKSFDMTLPSPWRLLKVWDQVGGIVHWYKVSMVYFVIFAWITQYTRNSGDWGYDWEGFYIGVFLISCSIFIGGCAGILFWIRKPTVVVSQG